MTVISGTVERIAAALGMSVDALISQSGKACYMRQCCEIMDLFSRLPDEKTREICLSFVRSIVNAASVR